MVASYADKVKADRERAAETSSQSVPAPDVPDSVSISEMLRPDVVGVLHQRIRDGEVGTADLIKLLALLNDRIDGKVTEKVEHTGLLSLQAVLESVTGKTAGLPKPEWFDEVDGVGYIDRDAALTAEVADGGIDIKESLDE